MRLIQIRFRPSFLQNIRQVTEGFARWRYRKNRLRPRHSSLGKFRDGASTSREVVFFGGDGEGGLSALSQTFQARAERQLIGQLHDRSLYPPTPRPTTLHPYTTTDHFTPIHHDRLFYPHTPRSDTLHPLRLTH